MLAHLSAHPDLPGADEIAEATHVLVLLPKDVLFSDLAATPLLDGLAGRLARRRMKPEELAKQPVTGELAHGAMAVWSAVDPSAAAFDSRAQVRGALQPLLEEKPRRLLVAVLGDDAARRRLAEDAAYVALLNGTLLPQRKKDDPGRALKAVDVYGWAELPESLMALAEGSRLTRELTLLPANELTPALYRERLRKLAKAMRWKLEEFDVDRLQELGAGAFIAVAQGSPQKDAAILRLSYRPKRAAQTVALVGKGICFDTGGHNLKPAKYMQGMHEDMNGSAVALGLLLAATRQALPVAIDCWLAIAQNHLSPTAYKPGDVVRALNGDTIEVIHTDAEGRMVLADTLTLAAREKPEVIVDFATLTGSCVAALGTRYSGVFSNQEALLAAAVEAGRASGERVCAFPQDADYDAALESKVADVKQCTLDGEADHILAARFLSRFVGDTPWLHMDLSSARCEGGLGAVKSDVTGFGVAWGDRFLKGLLGKG